MRGSPRSGRRVLRPALWAAAVAIMTLPAVGRPGPQDTVPGHLRTGEEVFLFTCVGCHGPDGKGMSQSRVGFSQPLPDFTNPDFTTREPDSDWQAIIHMGGPVRGFSQFMPALGEFLPDEEIVRVAAYLRSFCPEPAWPRGELNFPRALMTEKAFPEDEALFAATLDPKGHVFAGQVLYEQRFGARNQYEIQVPFGWTRVAAGLDGAAPDWVSSLGDVSVGAKRVFVHSLKRGSILAGGAEVIFPTGDEARGFGGGTFVVEPFVLFGQALPVQAFFQAQAGVEVPFRGAGEGYARLVLGKSFVTGSWGRLFSPMVELLAVRELVAGGEMTWDIVPQIQVTLSKRRHVRFNVGTRIPLNDPSSRHVQVLAYVLWDWFDGGLFEGW
jgi:mono/diheme cytochrome c family protein